MIGKISFIALSTFLLGYMIWISLPRCDLYINPIETQGFVDSVSVSKGSLFIRYRFEQNDELIKKQRILTFPNNLIVPQKDDELSIFYAKNYPDYVEVKQYPKYPSFAFSLIPALGGLIVFVIAILGVTGKIDLNKYYA